ncbi:Son of sevenless protein [Trema orientale]|uniref:Son of sevenless protein n=1 Tax=Trema orientale TaxID=63057 RepID=A0A2P5F9R2_TREOI|nr:Son of sevenless protein [Trema orientale]
MARRTAQVLDSIHLMNTTQIFKESIRVILLHPTQFHSISIFLFSPLPISLFISHLLIHHFPNIPSSTISLTHNLFGFPLPKLFSKTMIHIIICFPSSITFSLLGRAAIVQAVSDIYNGINLDGRRLFMRSGLTWIKLLYTTFWEYLIVFGLLGVFALNLVIMPKMFHAFGICSEILGFWGVLGVLGIPFCVAFAHVMVVGNLARVLSVLEGNCYGFESLLKAKSLMEGRRQIALVMALLSNIGFRLVESLFEFRMCKGINLWEGPLLVSMYSSVLVFDTVMNVVFCYACKSFNDQ